MIVGVSGEVRRILVDHLTTELGPAIDTTDPGEGRLTAHVALRTVEWVLDSSGLGPDDPRVEATWRALGQAETVDALAAVHRRREWEYYYTDDDDDEWPLPVGHYADLIETVLDTDLAALAVDTWRPATARFGAPTDATVIGCIEAQREFSPHDPFTWRIQRCIGLADPHADELDAELDRFVAQWSPMQVRWVEINRGQAIDHLVDCLRTSAPVRDPGERAARDPVDGFLYCFPRQTRYFTDTKRTGRYSFRITQAALDTGVVAISRSLAGIWWFAEAF